MAAVDIGVIAVVVVFGDVGPTSNNRLIVLSRHKLVSCTHSNLIVVWVMPRYLPCKQSLTH